MSEDLQSCQEHIKDLERRLDEEKRHSKHLINSKVHLKAKLFEVEEKFANSEELLLEANRKAQEQKALRRQRDREIFEKDKEITQLKRKAEFQKLVAETWKDSASFYKRAFKAGEKSVAELEARWKDGHLSLTPGGHVRNTVSTATVIRAQRAIARVYPRFPTNYDSD